jgi:glycerol-3-phosphate dehydrogenase (NAD(P)+)
MAGPQAAAVIGAGTWGTTLALLLAQNGIAVTLHCHTSDVAEAINTRRRNAAYFPEVELPAGVHAVTDWAQALTCRMVYLVVPTSFLEPVFEVQLPLWRNWSERGGLLCNCSKGLLLNPVRRVDAWLAELLPAARLAQLSGPNLATEIMSGHPAAAVASGHETAATEVQAQLSSARFRVYTGADMVGAEVAGFYKNIIAIAAGIVHGLGLGDNTRAALITRGLAEMARLTEYFGGERATLYGLAGVGDLIVTCGSTLSRNFRAGLLRAAGRHLAEIVGSLAAPGGGRSVAEGIQASLALHQWPSEQPAIHPPHAIGWPELPIAREVYRILHEDADPREAIARLMARPPKAE